MVNVVDDDFLLWNSLQPKDKKSCFHLKLLKTYKLLKNYLKLFLS